MIFHDNITALASYMSVTAAEIGKARKKGDERSLRSIQISEPMRIAKTLLEFCEKGELEAGKSIDLTDCIAKTKGRSRPHLVSAGKAFCNKHLVG